jgi:hypothetical protein
MSMTIARRSAPVSVWAPSQQPPPRGISVERVDYATTRISGRAEEDGVVGIVNPFVAPIALEVKQGDGAEEIARRIEASEDLSAWCDVSISGTTLTVIFRTWE